MRYRVEGEAPQARGSRIAQAIGNPAMCNFMEHDGEKHRQSQDGNLSNGFFQYLLGGGIYQ